jgi:endoglucanase
MRQLKASNTTGTTHLLKWKYTPTPEPQKRVAGPDELSETGLTPIRFSAHSGQLFGNEQPFHIKGINWHGSESRTGPPAGLDKHGVNYYMHFLAANDFNAVRLLFNHRSILASSDPLTAPPLQTDGLALAPELKGVSYVEMFVRLAQEAARHGILILLACHRLSPKAWPGEGLWYDKEIQEENVLDSWEFIAAALCGQWNVIGVDLQNEPHSASWGFGRATDWDKAAARIGNHVLSKCPRWLVFVEGVGFRPGAPGADSDRQGFWWGGNLVGAREAPVLLSDQTKLVYSPHTYGPSVYVQSYFFAEGFPINMGQIWEEHWGFVREATGQPVVIGEMGGLYDGLDKTWQDWALGQVWAGRYSCSLCIRVERMWSGVRSASKWSGV